MLNNLKEKHGQKISIDTKRKKELEMMLQFQVFYGSMSWQAIDRENTHTLAEEYSNFMFKNFSENALEIIVNSYITYNTLNHVTEEINMDTGEMYLLLKKTNGLKVYEDDDIYNYLSE